MQEIAASKKELEELLKLLKRKRAEIEGKDLEIAALEARLDDLYNMMELLEEEIARLKQIIAQLEAEIRGLLNQKPALPQIYVPVKGDEIDEKLAEYINANGTLVPWVRLSKGNYTYGTKRVGLKYMREHLIVRVGGGYMEIEEFVANYEDIELAKMNQLDPSKEYVTAQPELAGLNRQQKVALARGVSPRDSAVAAAG